MPAVNQFQMGPDVFLTMEVLFKYCVRNGVAVSPTKLLLGLKYDEVLQANQALKQLMAIYNKTASQVILRWALDLNMVALAGSTSDAHVRENADLDFGPLNDAQIRSLMTP